MSAQSAKPVPQLTPEQEHYFWSRLTRVDNTPCCWEWTGHQKSKLPYGCLTLNRKSLRAHRVAFATVTGVDVTGKLVAHRCDNPKCCNPMHLFLTDDEGNNRDRDAKNRWKPQIGPPKRNPCRGETNCNAKLTAAQVLEIKNAPEPSRQMAHEFGIHFETLRRIKAGKAWTHIESPPICQKPS